MSISQEDFIHACILLEGLWQRHSSSEDWQAVKVLENIGSRWLRITCTVQNEFASYGRLPQTWEVTQEVAIGEEDDEALQSLTARPEQPLVVYDIVYSPSYQVPVLYITFKALRSISRGLPFQELVYEMLVPPSFRQQMDGVGPVGALSTTDHPVTSTPAYFIHPCRTAEAMKAMTGGEEVKPAEYLLQWMGIIGHSVGLSVPLELAQAFAQSNGD